MQAHIGHVNMIHLWQHGHFDLIHFKDALTSKVDGYRNQAGVVMLTRIIQNMIHSCSVTDTVTLTIIMHSAITYVQTC